jgi:hypothetical protein
MASAGVGGEGELCCAGDNEELGPGGVTEAAREAGLTLREADEPAAARILLIVF